MKSWPVQPRGGFTALRNDIGARALGELTPPQFRMFVGTVMAAEFKEDGTTSPDGRWRIGYGEALVSLEGLARKYGESVSTIRRCLRRWESLGLCKVGRAKPGIEPGTDPGTPPGMDPGTPPTIVSFRHWFGIAVAKPEAGTPPGTPPGIEGGTDPGTIQYGNTGTPNPEDDSSSPSDSCSALTRGADSQEEDQLPPKPEPMTLVADDVKRFRHELARALGVKRVSFAGRGKRPIVAAAMADWIGAEGFNYVLEACVHRAYREAVERGVHPPDSVAWYAEAREDISDAFPAGSRATPDPGAMTWPSGGAMFNSDAADYWRRIVSRVSPAAACEWRRELDNLIASYPEKGDEHRAAWDRFTDKWRERAGLPAQSRKRTAA